MSMNLLSLNPLHFPPTKPTSFLNLKNKTKLNVGLLNFPTSSTFTCQLNVRFDDIAAVAQNKVLIAAGISAAVGQLSKPFTGVLLYGRSFDVKAVIQAGGFPSTHSSAVVATATCLALERGFSDSIFGLSVVYAGLIMYDAQGVRREVGIHAKTINRLLLERRIKSVAGENDIADSVEGISSSTNLESSRFHEEANASKEELTAATQLIGSKSQRNILKEIESEITPGLPLLKESIGHTEIEVIAGALLGFIISLIVNAII